MKLKNRVIYVGSYLGLIPLSIHRPVFRKSAGVLSRSAIDLLFECTKQLYDSFNLSFQDLYLQNVCLNAFFRQELANLHIFFKDLRFRNGTK